MKSVAIATVVAIIAMLLFSCSGKRPSNLRVTDGAFAPCPSSPNCISSDANDSGHQVAPFQLAVAPSDAWLVALDLISELPRTHIVTETADYLHAECRSVLFGFVDDLELHLRPTDGIIAVRSASRLGYSDIGVNRRRIEDLRSALIGRGVLR